MGYGMKYTKGGFPFKASPAKQDDFLKSQNEEAVKSTDYLMKTPNSTTASDDAKKAYEDGDATTLTNNEKSKAKREDEHVRFMNDKHHSIVPTINDFIGDAQNKQKASNKKSKKTKPSHPATPEGSKQRSKAEKALEKSEDEKGY